MVDDVVFLQRLLDQQQVEPVELSKDVSVGERVGRVGVDLQRDRSEGIPHRRRVGDVAAGLDLDLDAHVALVEVAADGLDQGLGRALDADAHPARHAIDRCAEVLPQRPSLGTEGGVEHRELEPRLDHPMSDERLEEAGDLLGGERPGIQQRRHEVALRDVPRALRVLARVQRRLLRDDLTPAVAASGLRPHDDDLAHRFGAERRRERRDERQVQHPQFDGFEGDGGGGSGDRHAVRLRPAGGRPATQRPAGQRPAHGAQGPAPSTRRPKAGCIVRWAPPGRPRRQVSLLFDRPTERRRPPEPGAAARGPAPRAAARPRVSRRRR